MRITQYLKIGSILCFLGCCQFIFSAGHARTVSQSLYVHPGIFSHFDTVTFQYVSFSLKDTFSEQPAIINLIAGDSLKLTISNRDRDTVRFRVRGQSRETLVILPNTAQTIHLHFAKAGLFAFEDIGNYPAKIYLGLSGMICVTPESGIPNFYWQLKEHQPSWYGKIIDYQPVEWDTYQPTYFTINGRVKPMIQTDTLAAIHGKVGKAHHIYINNGGASAHAMHFHGYHCRILFSSGNQLILNRWKDTLPIEPYESIVLELIPDKPGKFPVHDHNLIAVTGGGYYPRGMFLMMEIE